MPVRVPSVEAGGDVAAFGVKSVCACCKVFRLNWALKTRIFPV